MNQEFKEIKMKENRIYTIDLIRTIGIILMILAHVHDQWLDLDSSWFAAMLYTILSPIGIPSFVFATGLGFGFSWQLKKIKNLKFKDNAIYQLSRTIILLGIAFGYNFIGVIVHKRSLYNIWFWYILQTIAISRLLAILFIKFKSIIRFIFSIILVILTHFILFFLIPFKDTSDFRGLLYFILFNTIDADSILFFFPCVLIGTIIGEKIAIINEEMYVFRQNISIISIDKESELINKKRSIEKFLKQLIIGSLFFILIGVFSGLQKATYYYGWDRIIEQFKTNPNFNINSLPLFLVRNSYAWIIFGIGWILLLIYIFFSKIDYKILIRGEKEINKNNLKIIESICLFGKYSLTIYLTHYLAYLLPFNFNHYLILIAFIIFAAVIWFIIFAIDKFTNGRFSIEAIINNGANEILKIIYKKNNSIQIKRVIK